MKVSGEKDIEVLKELGERHAIVLKGLVEAIRPGITTSSLDELATRLIKEQGGTPAFKGYKPLGAPRPFPCSLCVAPNDTVVHGIPTELEYTLQEGDIVGLDVGIEKDGYIIDAGKTVAVGNVDKKAKKLLQVTYEALMRGVAQARTGNRVGDIGHAIESYVKREGYAVVRELCGHGVGHSLHEEPQVPNFGARGTGRMLEEGMVIAIEPMVNEGGAAVFFVDDGYTVKTADGSRSAHFEHNVIITRDDPIILTHLT